MRADGNSVGLLVDQSHSHHSLELLFSSHFAYFEVLLRSPEANLHHDKFKAKRTSPLRLGGPSFLAQRRSFCSDQFSRAGIVAT
jgi:hypothetical protein